LLLAVTVTSGRYANHVRIYDVKSSWKYAILRGHHNVVTDCGLSMKCDVAFSLSTYESVLHVWDVPHLIVRLTLPFYISTCALSADGAILAVAENAAIHLWDLRTPPVLQELAPAL
jgi:WD40 repeat protein